MYLYEKEFSIPAAPGHKEILLHVEQALKFRLSVNETPIRIAITETTNENYRCEVGVLQSGKESSYTIEPITNFSKRLVENTNSFNTVLLVPTGIGSEIGGHAGDATPVAKLLAEVSDTLITHPNVVNASDLNEMSDNTLYVEGSVISRWMMGTIGLQKTRSNRVIFVIDDHPDSVFTSAAINAVSAAHASYGFNCVEVVKLDPSVKMKSEYTDSGMAVGEIRNFEYLCEVLSKQEGDYDAIAVSSVIDVPKSYHQEYFDKHGEMVNPWGGVEAILTHGISEIFNMPSAHSPMFESQEIANANPGIVDPRMAAEAISMTFLQCIFKGLQRSPKIVTDKAAMDRAGALTAEDISCLVIPDGCVGLPTLAALEQGIPVIAVKENKNLMKNNLEDLPWSNGQLILVDNYLEAAGVISAMKAGITPNSVRRPLAETHFNNKTTSIDLTSSSKRVKAE